MYESAPWRTELRKFAQTVRDAPQWPSEEIPFDLERSLFYSAIVLRKLIEDRKLTDSFTNKRVGVPTHKAIAPEKSSVWRNMPGSVEFDWEKVTLAELPVKELCNQLVHFLGRYWWIEEDETVSGVVVCSYRHQDGRGYLIKFDFWANILEEAAGSWPTNIVMRQGHTPSIE